MSKQNTLRLVDVGCDGRMWTVLDMLKDCIEKMESDLEYNKAIVLFLNNKGELYSTSFAQAGLTRSEIIALLEVVKNQFISGLVGEERF